MAEANGDTLVSAVQQFPTMQDFLAADVVLPFHSCSLDDVSATTNPSTNVDGVVIKLVRLQDIYTPIHYFRLPHFESNKLRRQYPILKKHLDLSGLTDTAISTLTHIMGVNLGTTDGGYFLSLTAVPRDRALPDPRLSKEVYVREETVGVLNAVVENFKKRLQELPPKQLSRPTLQKTCLSNLARMNLLPQDQRFVLGLLDLALAEAGSSSLVHLLCTMSKFGMDTQALELDATSSLSFATWHFSPVEKCHIKSAFTHSADR